MVGLRDLFGVTRWLRGPRPGAAEPGVPAADAEPADEPDGARTPEPATRLDAARDRLRREIPPPPEDEDEDENTPPRRVDS